MIFGRRLHESFRGLVVRLRERLGWMRGLGRGWVRGKMIGFGEWLGNGWGESWVRC